MAATLGGTTRHPLLQRAVDRASEAADVLADKLGAIADPRATQHVMGSAVLALGRIGDPAAIDPLLGVAEPGKTRGRYSPLLRGLAVVALGQIAAKRDVRALTRIARDLNVHVPVPALDEAVTIN